jgi:hypothetical protein
MDFAGETGFGAGVKDCLSWVSKSFKRAPIDAVVVRRA